MISVDYQAPTWWEDPAFLRARQAQAHQAAVKAHAAALAAHPLADCLAGVDDASRRASESPRLLFKSRQFPDGSTEVVVSRQIATLDDTLERAIRRDCRSSAPRGEGDRDASRVAAARRAKQQVRHVCKTIGVNSLWTLTYRANVQDREVVLRHLNEFRRRVVALLGDWRYVAVLERQQRGAFHIHLATHALPVRLLSGGVRVKSWDVMRRIWLRIVGDLGGSFNEAKPRRRYGAPAAMRRPGQIASYLAGYVAKDMLDSELNRKRYSHSTGIAIPAAYRVLYPPETSLQELIELAYAAIDGPVVACWFDKSREVFYLDAGPPG